MLSLSDTIKLVKVYIVSFCDKLKHVKKSLKVKNFLNFCGTYKKVSQVADITTTLVAIRYLFLTMKQLLFETFGRKFDLF